MERILVTGGSGFIGGHVIDALKAANPSVEIHNIDLRPSTHDVHDHVGGLHLRETYEAVPSVDAVLHLAAVAKEPGYPRETYYLHNALATRYLADWAEEHQPSQIIYTSSVAVYGPCEQPVDESSLVAPETAYGMSKLLGEHHLQQWAARNDRARLAVIRPGVVFGPGDEGNFPRLVSAIEQGWFLYPGRRDTKKSNIYVFDLVRLILWMLHESPGRNVLVNASYTPVATMEEIGEAIATALGRSNTRQLCVPEWAVRMGAMVGNAAERTKPVADQKFHRRRVDKLVESTNVESSVLHDLGFDYEYDTATALRDWLTSEDAEPTDRPGPPVDRPRPSR
jgi:GlcNAc-P-P-Und epimerase